MIERKERFPSPALTQGGATSPARRWSPRHSDCSRFDREGRIAQLRGELWTAIWLVSEAGPLNPARMAVYEDGQGDAGSCLATEDGSAKRSDNGRRALAVFCFL
ncbi:hypothetical protein CSQ89_07870 [Chitinimonas sp. BJB300]|nr:hypothetical protein CSQ89_07870 [Chitinimonas sp. BJB300]